MERIKLKVDLHMRRLTDLEELVGSLGRARQQEDREDVNHVGHGAAVLSRLAMGRT